MLQTQRCLSLRKSSSCARRKDRGFCVSTIVAEIKNCQISKTVFQTQKAKISSVRAWNTDTDAKANHTSQKSHVAIEGNVKGKQGDGLTKSHVITDKDLSCARIPNTNIFV